MPKLTKRITDSLARSLRAPETPAEIKSRAVVHWCRETPGFGVKVSLTGDRSFVFERRVDGQTKRRTLGKAPGAKGAGAISTDTARGLCVIVSSELQTGIDRVEVKREERKTEKEAGITLAVALAEYVKGKRSGKSGLPLKVRTQLDYLAMVAAGRKSKDGKPFADGPLFDLADIPLGNITAKDIKTVYDNAEGKSQRQAVYAMQVLRAVLNWHGTAIPDSPLAKATAGKDRIVLAKTAGDPTPIPKAQLGAWWRAATALAGNVGADGCRAILLTGCRPGELFGSSRYTGGKTIVLSPGLLVRDIDLTGRCMTLVDTKNRSDHTVVLSSQALEIVKTHCKGKKATDKVFDVLDPGKTLESINMAAGVVGITPHKLRHTFASAAARLCSVFELKAMLNHAATGDVTADHYVDVDDSDLATAWQKVADFIVAAQ
jgi:integrase